MTRKEHAKTKTAEKNSQPSKNAKNTHNTIVTKKMQTPPSTKQPQVKKTDEQYKEEEHRKKMNKYISGESHTTQQLTNGSATHVEKIRPEKPTERNTTRMQTLQKSKH